MAIVSPNKYVFIDASYLLFHRYYAVVAWAKMSGYDLAGAGTGDIVERFNKGFELYMIRLQKKLDVSWDRVVMVYDCPRETIWRMAHFPGYKAGRVCGVAPGIFEHSYNEMLPSLQAKWGFLEMRVDTAEADDVIAVCCKWLFTNRVNEARTSAADGLDVVVITNDNDYVQLATLGSGLSILNANFLNIVERFSEEELEFYVDWKVIKGDKSDGIPSIAKKIGDKTALKLARDRKALALKCEVAEVRAQYELNRLLIDFCSIPEDIQEAIRRKFVALMPF